METLSIEELASKKSPLSVAIGFFDGVHLGHQSVIKKAVRYGKKHQIKSVVITFDISPKVVLKQRDNASVLMTTTDKLEWFEGLGVDYALVLTCDEDFLKRTPAEFVNDYLKRINTTFISVGFDFRFGYQGAGQATDLARLGDFEVEIIKPVTHEGLKISSTEIRANVLAGNFEKVSVMLNRYFLIKGRVINGQKKGRIIGFPTANLAIDGDYIRPAKGVYATIIGVDGKVYASMTNVGHNPTMNFSESIQVETHILGVSEDIYDKNVKLFFVKKIRDEVKFDGVDALKAQLEADKKYVKSLRLLPNN